MYIKLIYAHSVKSNDNDGGARATDNRRSDSLLIRLQPSEKESFQQCADLSGVALSSWIRERLRFAAIRELESAGRKVPFLKNITPE